MVRMSETEALMWSVEKDPALRSDFCNLTIVDGPIDLERLRHALWRAIAAVPRLGQRVVEPPLKVTTPEWVAVEHLDLDDHLHVVELPAPGDERTLLDFCAAYAETPFDRAVPLWHFVVITGLAGGRNAMLQKVHHTITDGIGGLKLSLEIVDFDADGSLRPAPVAGPTDLAPVAPPADLSRLDATRQALGDAAARTVKNTGAALASAGRAITDPRGAPGRVSDALSTAASLRRQLLVTEHARSDLIDDRSLLRHFELRRYPMEPLRAAARQLGGSLNDAFVTIVAGALGEYHRRLGSTVDELRMAMPVNTRGRGTEGGANHFTPSRVLVPIRGDLDDRFAETRRRLDEAKHERSLELAGNFASMLIGVPDAVLVAVARSQTATIDFATSNLRGSPVPLYLGGARIVANHPLGPRTGCAVNFSLLSYCDELDVGINLDPFAITDVGALLEALDASFAEFVAVAASVG